MAKVALKTENLTGPQLVNEAKVLFAEVLASFRECHVLCVKSGLFSSKMILEIDTCAVTFRQMCLDTVTVARVVSDQWLDSTIMFFENIKDFDDPTEMIDLLGNQAKEIGQLFKVIAAWARDLGGRFNKAQDNTIAEAEEFKKAFAEAVKSAEEVKERAEEQREKAQAKRRDTQESEDKWKTAQVAVSWIPIGALVTGIGSSIAGSKRAEAEKIEQAANRNLRKAEDELEKRSGDNEKAQVCNTIALLLPSILILSPFFLCSTLRARLVTLLCFSTEWRKHANLLQYSGRLSQMNSSPKAKIRKPTRKP